MNKTGSETLHGSVSSFIRSKIYDKELAAGDKIPSEHRLMDEFAVSRGTVRKAIKALVDEGLLTQERGRGTFVCAPYVTHPDEGKPFSFAESFNDRGIEFDTHVLMRQVIPANVDIAAQLHVEPGDQILRLRRLRSAGHTIVGVARQTAEVGIALGQNPF